MTFTITHPIERARLERVADQETARGFGIGDPVTYVTYRGLAREVHTLHDAVITGIGEESGYKVYDIQLSDGSLKWAWEDQIRPLSDQDREALEYVRKWMEA